MALTLIDLAPRIGTEIQADRAELLSGEHSAQIRALLQQRGVLVLKAANFTSEEQLQFSHSLGKVQAVRGDEVFKVSIDPDENPGAEYIKGAFFWHIDGASDDVPNFAATLNAKVLSKTGGSTYFANTYAAYDDLPVDERMGYDDLRVVHSFETSQRYVNPEPTPPELEFWQHREPKVHPLVWKHQNGRRSFVLGSTADYVEGMDPARGRMILSRLRTWATQDQFVYRHNWTLGDLLIWDNTGTMHRVDVYPLEDGRMMHRTTIEAEEELV